MSAPAAGDPAAARPAPEGAARRTGTARTWLYGRFVIAPLMGLARALRHAPGLRPERHGLRVEADRPYREGGDPAHRLDVWRPAAGEGPWPVVIHVHGGGFRYFDKATHWAMAAAFARQGFLTFNVNYRLAHRAPYPAAVEDVAAAVRWVAANAAGLGGDPARQVWAGESAGANLVTAATVAACWPRPEPWARALHEEARPPAVLLPACGYLELSDPERHGRERPLGRLVAERITEVSDEYVPDHRAPGDRHAFANLLSFLEGAPPPARPLPPLFALVGERDPVQGDTTRLVAAARRLGGVAEARVYEGAGHAFHAARWKEVAQRAWADQWAFVDRHLPGGLPGGPPAGAPRGAGDLDGGRAGG